MAGESCNLDKEEAELLKPSSPSSPSSSPAAAATAAATAPPPLFLRPPTQRTPEATAAGGAASCHRGGAGEKETPPPGRSASRCSSCRRRVGLTGFRCRCGDLFCARHRHAGAHDCSFDYKATGREEISRANPLVRAAKIIKI